LFAFLTAKLAKPLAKKLPEGAAGKLGAVDALLAGGTGDEWIPLARQQSSLPSARELRAESSRDASGAVRQGDTDLSWRQYDWDAATLDHCVLHRVRWRFYKNGLVCLEVAAGKEDQGLDRKDLVGHTIELRDGAGFLIGVWTAAFLLYKGDAERSFQASIVDDHKPLALHYDELANEQQGVAFRI